MYNKIVLVGNLTRDIDLKHLHSGMAIAKTAIATSRKFKSKNGEQKEEVCFVEITFFGRSAEVANQYLRKGSKILVEGRLVFEQWTDQTGQRRSKHGVTVDVMQMLDSKDSNTHAQGAPQNINTSQTTYQPSQQNQRYGQQVNTNMNTPQSEDIPSIDISEDEIPF